MLRVARSSAPAWRPALFLCLALVLGLQGCSLLPKKDASDAAASAKPVETDNGQADDERHGFAVRVEAPDEVREHLERHLELQRYRQLDDLGTPELSRLMVAAEANARELLNTLGYFTPTLTLELHETPDDPAAPREVRITVLPGERTRVGEVQISFSGPIANDPEAVAQRDAIRAGWRLGPGSFFSQQDWDGAKAVGLRGLVARRYPTGSIVNSRAEIDADRRSARLGVNYQSGPAYRFGPLQINGIRRYDADAMRRIAQLPTGADYDQQKLLDAQARLASSGYFDSVFLTLDTDGTNPQFAPVIAQVREAPLQKVVLGAGFTTDSGPRVSIDHTHNRMPLLGWRAVSRASIDRNVRSLGSAWTAIPNDEGWRWGASGEVKQEASGTYDVNSGRLRASRSKNSERIDRSYFLQYDYAEYVGEGAPPSASALSFNWGWTGRYFDDAAAPRRGWGFALELGAGYTLAGRHLPFTRIYARGLGILPLGRVPEGDEPAAARQSRLALRAELGAVVARDEAQIPSTLLFLTGGDTTVRGYGYRQIGTLDAGGATVAGRYLGVASLEWQRPYVHNGRLTDWESVVFVDAGAVADKPGNLEPQVGVGVGARWRSPVGPVQADLAYGVDVKKFRLHLRLGFSF